MRKQPNNYKPIRDRILVLEKMPRCEGHDTTIDGKVYFVPDSVAHAVAESATMEQLVRICGEEADEGLEPDEAKTDDVLTWYFSEILKRLTENERK